MAKFKTPAEVLAAKLTPVQRLEARCQEQIKAQFENQNSRIEFSVQDFDQATRDAVTASLDAAGWKVALRGGIHWGITAKSAAAPDQKSNTHDSKTGVFDMAKSAAKAVTITEVTYHLDYARLSNELRTPVEDITTAELDFTYRLLMSTFRDHYDEAAKVFNFDGSGDLYGVGFKVEVAHPDMLPAFYPKAQKLLKRVTA